MKTRPLLVDWIAVTLLAYTPSFAQNPQPITPADVPVISARASVASILLA